MYAQDAGSYTPRARALQNANPASLSPYTSMRPLPETLASRSISFDSVYWVFLAELGSLLIVCMKNCLSTNLSASSMSLFGTC